MTEDKWPKQLCPHCGNREEFEFEVKSRVGVFRKPEGVLISTMTYSAASAVLPFNSKVWCRKCGKQGRWNAWQRGAYTPTMCSGCGGVLTGYEDLLCAECAPRDYCSACGKPLKDAEAAKNGVCQGCPFPKEPDSTHGPEGRSCCDCGAGISERNIEGAYDHYDCGSVYDFARDRWFRKCDSTPDPKDVRKDTEMVIVRHDQDGKPAKQYRLKNPTLGGKPIKDWQGKPAACVGCKKPIPKDAKIEDTDKVPPGEGDLEAWHTDKTGVFWCPGWPMCKKKDPHD